MTHSLHPSATKGFGSGAELYQQVRPSYPQEIAIWLQDRLQIGESSTVIDLGSGTGKFLPYLIQTQAKVIAVEPVAEMLQQLQQAHRTVECVQGLSVTNCLCKMNRLMPWFVPSLSIGSQTLKH
ncbi:hypothetical protein F973_01030 [Acinetobacter sp. CIP 102129]|nr:hypothetical protein F973_01030 [Acinetobacter sp. CIP 102129]